MNQVFEIVLTDDTDQLEDVAALLEAAMPGEVELRVGAVPGVGDAQVNLIWDPPWDPQKMSDEAKLELGML